MNQYIVGTLLSLNVAFTDTAGNPVDPSSVAAEIRLPDDSVQQITPVNHTGVGQFNAAFTPTMNGLHEYRFSGVGAVVVAGESSFMAQTTF